MPYSHILFQVEESGIALLTVNRPEKLNALSSAVMEELAEAFARVAGDAAIRALIAHRGRREGVRGRAPISPNWRSFRRYECAALALRGQAVFRRLETCGKPSVAAVNGFALGGGLELAMACTVRFASENAKLGQPEVKLGIIPGYGGTQRLPRLVGRGRALELLLTGDPISAAEAYRIGLVNAVTPQAELLDYSRAWLGKVLANASAGTGSGDGRGGYGAELRARGRAALRGRGIRRERGHGRSQGRHARVSGETARGVYRKVRHVEGI